MIFGIIINGMVFDIGLPDIGYAMSDLLKWIKNKYLIPKNDW